MEDKKLSRRDVFRMARGGLSGIVASNKVAKGFARFTETRDVERYKSCEYSLNNNFLDLRTQTGSKEKNLRIRVIRKNLSLRDSNYRQDPGEVVVDDTLNANYNCHSFTLEQVTGIEKLGIGSNVWIDNPEMKKVLDTYGQEYFDSAYYETEDFKLPEIVQEGDVLALFNQKNELLHSGIYHTSFNGKDTTECPYVSKFGSDKLMARSLNSVIRLYWLNSPDTDQIKMKVYKFDPSFKFDN